MYVAKTLLQNSTVVMLGSVKIAFQLITNRNIYSFPCACSHCMNLLL